MAFIETVMPGDIAGQHPRIGGFGIAGDQGDAHPRHRPHAKALQHMDVGVAAADQMTLSQGPRVILSNDLQNGVESLQRSGPGHATFANS